MSDKPMIQTHVWHAGICYVVDTVARPPSGMAVTTVWLFHWDTRERGRMPLHHDTDRAESIVGHQRIVEAIHDTGPEAFKHYR